jgi:dipeptidyl aminopeptidase/acylaminoacyl peptidase
MRRDIEFKTEDGVTLRGWHYLPDGSQGRVPTIVMAHGFSAVKEMYLDQFAEAFANAGLGVLVFDNRLNESPHSNLSGEYRALRFA